jgi:hypothetical protein
MEVLMNIVVYNFFQESAETINEFLEIVDASVFFAVSFQDLNRICSEHQIDMAIIKLDKKDVKLLLDLMFHFDGIKFIVPDCLKPEITYQNVTFFSKKSSLASIGKQMI